MKQNNELIIFEDKAIRSVEYDGETFFSVVDVIAALTDSAKPRDYWSVLKKREPQLPTVCRQLKMPSTDGKNYQTNVANTEGVLRIIMSVPSPKAEPFKQWLAQNGKQTIDEAENPELGIERIIEIYKARGNSDEWIKNRLQSIETRKALTDEWKQRGVNEGQEYAILTATIAKGTFGLSPSEHSNLKGLERQNLRDHMTPLELIFTALGEEITRSEAVDTDAQGFNENHEAAQKGGSLAGKARQLVEKERNKKVVSSDNFLSLNANKNDTKELNNDDNKTE
jgi:DNA-damage-inducible protein D